MTKSKTLLLLFSMMLAISVFVEGRNRNAMAQVSSIRIGTPFRIYPSNVTQTEPFIVRHPTNNNLLFASASTINFGNGFYSEGVYVSTNAGATWAGSDTCNGQLITSHRCDPGIAIDKNGTFILVRKGTSPGIYGHSSVDNGRTWTSQRTITTQDVERASVQSDVISSSARYGRTYAVWARLAAPYALFMSYTDNGGGAWSAPAQINAPNPSHVSFDSDLSIGLNGRVNVCWSRHTTTSPFIEDFLGFATSTDGGANWTVTENAIDMNGIKGLLAQKANIRVNSYPRMDTDRSGGTFNGRVYVAVTQRALAPAGNDPDIILHRSTDNGASWLAPVRVNGDAINNGKTQFFPVVHVDDGGGVNVLYFDDRRTTTDSSGVFLSRSTNAGTTWTDYEISNRNFKPAAIGGLGAGYQGDNISLMSVGTTLIPVWMDNSSGIYQAWASLIDLTTLSIGDDNSVAREFSLKQNYPNPFNPSTKITFEIPNSEFVNLTVFDLLGQEVTVLANEQLNAGRYERAFDATSLSSGMYFYTLQAGSFSAMKKMIIIR